MIINFQINVTKRKCKYTKSWVLYSRKYNISSYGETLKKGKDHV